MALKDNIRIILKGIALVSALYINSQLSKDVVAQITYPVDSIRIEFGKISKGYDRRAITEPTWELKNEERQVRDTIDFGKMFLSKDDDALPTRIYGNGFGVDGTGSKFDTVLVKGEIYSWPEDTPMNETGVGIFGYVNNGFDSFFLGENYLEPRAIYTDEQGKWTCQYLCRQKKTT